jgi:N-acetylglucosaminyl-diphospho-decaprenol L-rhamnosyltransferase
MNAPALSIIIVNMNTADWLQQCLVSISQTKGSVGLEVILIDNASTDLSIEVAQQVYPEIYVLPQLRNVGYVPANNLGLASATGRYVMFLNNDVRVYPGCFQELVSFLDDHPDVGAVSGQILNPDGSDQGCARRFPTVMNGLFGRRSLLTRLFPRNPWSKRYMIGRQVIDDHPFEVEILSSACLVLRAELAKDLGGMDEDFKLYWVDAELCSRVRQRGYKVYCVPRAKIMHYEGQGGSTKTWRQRCRATLCFHQDAYRAYYKVYHLPRFHPRRLFAAIVLSVKASGMIVLQFLRPGKATSSGGRN